MPPWLSQLLGGGLGSLFKDIVGTFKADPNKVLEFQELIAANDQAIRTKEMDLAAKAADVEIQLNQTAGENIRAEAATNSKFVSWARPSVIWMGNLVVTWNYALMPFIGLKWHLVPINLPDTFWYTWGACVLGYVAARTGQELGQRLLGGAGGSAQLPFGIKLDSKGD